MQPPEVIDQPTFSRLLESLGGDVDFLNELVEAYLASTPELFATMQKAISAGDAPVLQRAAHSLKSGSNNFGALAFAALCKELEDIAKTGILASAEEKYSRLKAVYPEVATELQSLMQSARSTSS